MSNIEAILQCAEMEVPRSPRDLTDWVDSKACELSQSEEGKRYARSGKLLPKKLWEEIRPLGLFALKRYGPDGAACTPNLTNDNYDGKIEFESMLAPTVYVEITYAKDGYDERLRLNVLNEEGSVNALDKVAVSGTKASGRQNVRVANEAVKHVETRDSALAILKKRIKGKSEKKYGSNYVLVVVVDDYLPFRTEEDKSVLMAFAKDILSKTALNFGAVYLLGSSGEYCARVAGEI